MAHLPPEMPLLTDRQVEVLRMIRGYYLERRYYPTQRELCGMLGVRSTNARPYIEPLIAKGYLERVDRPGTRRGVKFTPLAMELFESTLEAAQQTSFF